MLRIGPVELQSNLLLAPIAGYTDLPFRILCRELGGVGIAYTDLLNAHALLRGSERSLELAATNELDRPCGMQLYGNGDDPLPEAAIWAMEHGAQVIDINMGCPVDKVAKKNGGSLLLRDCPATAVLAERIVKAVDRASGGRVPVTAKMRLGWDPEHMVAPDLARRLADVGIAAITVHGRYTVQFFSGQVDWGAIGRVVEAVPSIPVIGNGDVVEPEHAKALMDRSGCAGVMIARAALRTPWMFRRAAEHLATGAVGPDLSFNAKCRAILRHIDLMERFAKPWYGIKRLNQGIAWYGRTMGHIKPLKEAIRTSTTFEAMRVAIQDWMTPDREGVPAVLRGREAAEG
ncbi:MAG: tRNA dihydrouridine synthase DusB [Planctomycetes bacterium]|nr:tRNA dihydrouridine synthase DusB [Planctomycetota bacterium]